MLNRCLPLVLLHACQQLCCLKTKKRAGRRQEVRYSHANEEPISRENKGEDALIRVLGVARCSQELGWLKPTLQEVVKCFRFGQGPGKRRPGTWGFGATAWRAHCPLLGCGAYLRSWKHGVLVEAEHCVSDDVVIGQKTAAHNLGGSRRKQKRRN